MRFGFLSVSLEIITSYCFSQHTGAIETPGFRDPTIAAIEGTNNIFFINQHFPFLGPLIFGHKLKKLFQVNLFGKSEEALKGLHGVLQARVKEVLTNPASLDVAEHETVFHHLISSESRMKMLSPGEKPNIPSATSLFQEAGVLVMAGTGTVGNVCSRGMYYVLGKEEVREKLVRELTDAWPDREQRLDLDKLEKLPYLVRLWTCYLRS